MTPQHRTLTLSGAVAAIALLLAVPAPVLSQVPPPPGGGAPPGGGGGGSGSGAGAGAGMPSKAEIEKRIKEELEKLPERTAELGRIKILYRAVPSDPIELLKSSGAVPPGVNAEAAAKQFMPIVRPLLDKQMAEIGKLITDEEFKVKTTKVVPAEYTFGLVMQDTQPVAIRLTGKELKQPLIIKLKGSLASTPYSSLVVEVKEVPNAKKGEFTIDVGFGKVLGAGQNLARNKE
jgi:hypothetical protein